MFNEFASPAAVVVAAVFALAAIAKLREPGSTDAAIASFGLPRIAGRVLAPIELAIAIALLVRPVFGALGAVMLLTVFCVVVTPTVRQSKQVRCGCFGGSGDRPLGFDSIVRNLGLALLAVLAMRGPRQFRWPSPAAVLVVGGLCAGGSVILELLRIRLDTGTLFGQQLPGVGKP